MLRNFFVVALRNLWKNRLSSVISLFGLTIAIGSSIVCFLYVDQAFHLDTFHENGERMFLVENVIERSGSFETWGDSPTPLGAALKANSPYVEDAVRLRRWSGEIRLDENSFDEELFFVDTGFYDVFSFSILQGDPDALNEQQNIVITQELAEKYFGDENPIGRELVLYLGHDNIHTVVVGAVAENPPMNSSFLYTILLPFENLKAWDIIDIDDWSSWTSATVVLLAEGASPADLLPLLQEYISLQNEASTDWPALELPLMPFLDVTKNNENIRGCLFRGAPVSATASLIAIAVLLLFLACFNFTNASLVNVTRRYREIGIRKVVGSTKAQLALQHLGESLLFAALALLSGILFAQFVVIPGWYAVFSDFLRHVTLTMSPRVWIFFGSVVLLTGIGAGAYPALFVSGFRPVDIFRGPTKTGGHGKITKLLIAFQFAFTFMALVFPVALYLNLRYQQNLDWGYNKEQVFAFHVGDNDVQPMLNSLADDPDILSMAPSRLHIGNGHYLAVINANGVDRETYQLMVGPNYMQTMGIRLLDGSLLPSEPGEGDERMVVVNQSMVEAMEWEEPVGQQFVMREETYTVAGVVEDFHSNDFQVSITPLFLRLADLEDCHYVAVRMREGTSTVVVDRIRDKFRELYPDESFDGFFQDTVFDELFRLNSAIIQVFGFSAFASLLISVMGLFGLVSATLTKRQKEISIRKVLGATLSQVIQLISRPIVLLLIIASGIASVPAAYLLNLFMDDMYTYHIDLTATPFLLTIGIIGLFSMVTMLLLIYRTAQSNPASVLRSE